MCGEEEKEKLSMSTNTKFSTLRKMLLIAPEFIPTWSGGLRFLWSPAAHCIHQRKIKQHAQPTSCHIHSFAVPTHCKESAPFGAGLSPQTQQLLQVLILNNLNSFRIPLLKKQGEGWGIPQEETFSSHLTRPTKGIHMRFDTVIRQRAQSQPPPTRPSPDRRHQRRQSHRIAATASHRETPEFVDATRCLRHPAHRSPHPPGMPFGTVIPVPTLSRRTIAAASEAPPPYRLRISTNAPPSARVDNLDEEEAHRQSRHRLRLPLNHHDLGYAHSKRWAKIIREGVTSSSSSWPIPGVFMLDERNNL